MSKISLLLLLLLFILYSCKYPDIDTVPKFNSLNVSLDEKLDKCKSSNRTNIIKEDCYKALKQFTDRL